MPAALGSTAFLDFEPKADRPQTTQLSHSVAPASKA